MYLPYLPEASYMYSPANQYIVLKKVHFNEISGPNSFFVYLFYFRGGGGGHLPSLFDASYGTA